MNELMVVDRGSEWRRLKALVLDSVSSPITRRVSTGRAVIFIAICNYPAMYLEYQVISDRSIVRYRRDPAIDLRRGSRLALRSRHEILKFLPRV